MKCQKSICATILLGITIMLNAQNIPWERLRMVYDDPNSKALNDYAIVDNVPIVKPNTQNISGEYFAIASILRFFEMNGNTKFPFLDSPEFLSQNINLLLDKLLETPPPDKKKIITEQLYMYLNSFRKEASAIANKAGILYSTEGQLLVILLNRTAPEANEALQKMLFAHFYQAKPLRTIKADIQVARVLLNIGIPFIIKEKEQFSICVGYWADNAGVKFIVCGLSQANPVKISRKEFNFLRRKTIPFQIGKEDDKVMVEDDFIFSLNNKQSLEFCRAIAFPQNAEMIIVSKPSFNEDIFRDFLLKKVKALEVSK